MNRVETKLQNLGGCVCSFHFSPRLEQGYATGYLHDHLVYEKNPTVAVSCVVSSVRGQFLSLALFCS